MAAPRKYPLELMERGVRMVLELRVQDPEDRGVLSRVAKQLGVHPEALRHYVRQTEVDAGLRTGVPSSEAARIKELEREVRELRRANDILKSAAAFFGAELDRRGNR
ncbi:transposase [Pseudonocardia alaniniphila]|uniref:Transposase n=1 Tax=Pseudonocardia alaniniphila TaxID=75291 RepID=A0ABS9TV10_9PSEU|nr:transposase [Pseudonocardia alaniniphila]MCH6172389.1 transposase [Pseudonocardia alaniniphila]